MDRSLIYDKIRLCLQREGRFDAAVKFGLLAHLSWAPGLYLQQRNDDPERHASRETVRRVTCDLLRKMKKEHLGEEVSRVAREALANLPAIDFEEVGGKIDAMLLA